MPLLTVRELEQVSPVFRGKAGNAFAEVIMRLLSIDRINELYDRNSVVRGPDFAAAILGDIGMDRVVRYQDGSGLSLPEGPFITVSNHPCGHVDGISLIDVFGHIRPDYKLMVNQILSRIEPLSDSVIPVTPTGKTRMAPTSASVSGIKAALMHLRSGGSLGLFPSGAVSDLSIREHAVRDREWQEPVIRLIMKAGVPVVPVRFFEGNSAFYYSLGLLDWRIRLLRLPAEVFDKKGKTMHIGIGKVISVEEQRRYGHDIQAFGDFLRRSVYEMA